MKTAARSYGPSVPDSWVEMSGPTEANRKKLRLPMNLNARDSCTNRRGRMAINVKKVKRTAMGQRNMAPVRALLTCVPYS